MAREVRIAVQLAVLHLALLACTVQAQVTAERCGSLQNSIGPYDFRTERGGPLQLVESAHFTASVEMAQRGNAGYLGQDLDYTLRAFPNHHRALLAVIRYTDRVKNKQPSDLRREVECYLERAVRWRPDDVVARMIYAQWLYRQGRGDDARGQLEAATRHAGDSPLTHYNLGLVYLEGKDYDLALQRAHKAYALGGVRPDLKNQLEAAGRWREAAESATAAPAGAASSPGRGS